jgi:ribonuclease D
LSSTQTTPTLHRGDLPEHFDFGASVAVDTETMGLVNQRDRLCLVQLSRGDGTADLVQIAAGQREAPNLVRLLRDTRIEKLFHFARFDMAILQKTFGIMPGPIYCTKIASKLARTYTDRHGLKDLVRELLGQEISKQQQSSDWGAPDLTDAQLAYAASDVLHLHAIRQKLDIMLQREGRLGLAVECFAFLPTRVRLDLMGWGNTDIFAHD